MPWSRGSRGRTRRAGTVIERATLLAEGPDFTAIVAWITAHAGRPEAAAAGRLRRPSRRPWSPGESLGPPLRYVLPAGTF